MRDFYFIFFNLQQFATNCYKYVLLIFLANISIKKNRYESISFVEEIQISIDTVYFANNSIRDKCLQRDTDIV